MERATLWYTRTPWRNGGHAPSVMADESASRRTRLGNHDFSPKRAGADISFGTVRSVRIATWNVNSLKQRVPRLLPWLDERRPDVVCLQETKVADDAFAEALGDELSSRGYEAAVHGEAAWNGVAIVSQ